MSSQGESSRFLSKRAKLEAYVPFKDLITNMPKYINTSVKSEGTRLFTKELVGNSSRL